MIDRQTYEALLHDFGYTSSWAIWATPSNGNWGSKDSISDMDLFDDCETLLNSLNGNYIFVGLNPASHEHRPHLLRAWENFHSNDVKRSQDYKLRYALYDTQYWGSFITDIYTGIVETDSARVVNRTTQEVTDSSIEDILRIREILGGTATIIAMGNAAYSVLQKSLPENVELKMITHHENGFGLWAVH